MSLEYIELETAPDPRFAVIWMHGLGADGSDFVPVVPHLGLNVAVRFLFPHAPMIPVTCNGGYVMRAWYDIRVASGIEREVDEAGIAASCRLIQALIAQENRRGIPSERIVLAGFSQGGAMAYTLGLTHPDRLRGLIALSAYLPAPGMIEDKLSDANRATPIFAAHGSEDDIVPLALGEQARDTLLQLGHPLDWHTYPMPHSVCLEEIEATGQWLAARLSNQP
jgi:phospholipase/carboxylesterase